MEEERQDSVVAVAAVVVAVECVAGNSKAEEWGGFGGVAQEGTRWRPHGSGWARERGAGGGTCWRPYGPGCTRLCTPAFRRRDTSVEVRVRGGKDLQACVLPHPAGGRKQYVLRSLHDPNYVLGFGDRLESDCLALQGKIPTTTASSCLPRAPA
jgi:hypothetical protein